MMETFGIMAFVLVMYLWSRVGRLERTLRENNIRPSGTSPLGGQIQKLVGQTVTIALYEAGGGTTTPCRVLDVDEEWARVLRNEGRKNQRELLIRLADIKQIKS